MSRSFFYSAFLIFTTFIASAEANKHPQFRFIGLEAGFNMAGIRSANHYDRHEKNTGAGAVFYVNYSLSDHRSFEAALAFDQKGATDPVYDIRTNMNYITLPLSYKIVTGKDPRLYFSAGVYSGWLLSAGRKGEKLVEGSLIPVNENVTANYRSFDYGVIFGAGMAVKLYDDFDFVVGVRTSIGLFNIEEVYGTRPKNYHINISLGYIYYIGFR